MPEKIFKYLLFYTCVLQSHGAYQDGDDIEEINIGDDFDASIFNTANKIIDSITISNGFTINGVKITKDNKSWVFGGEKLYKTFTWENLKKQKHKFLNTISFFNPNIAYKIVLSKHFVFLIGIKYMGQKFYFPEGSKISFQDIASKAKENDSIDGIAKEIEKTKNKGKEIPRRAVTTYWNLMDKKKSYETSINEKLKNNLLFMALYRVGACFSFAWYSKMQNLSKSWFIKFPLLYIGVQKLSHLTMAQNKNQDNHPSSSSNLRVRSFTFMGGFEIGYSHISFEFFMDLAAILDNDLTYTVDLKESPQGKNLYSYGFIVKYNFC